MTSQAAVSTAAAPVAVAPVAIPVKHHHQRKALAVLYALTGMESREGHWSPTKMASKLSGAVEGVLSKLKVLVLGIGGLRKWFKVRACDGGFGSWFGCRWVDLTVVVMEMVLSNAQ
ncbi:hypothetical protein V6N11_071792 [Hibiscus sabdariffa]|uniref:Uncharacterized protein n=1 Tax=Hibiscus sabdariffa TaxID=183260 RepID=A0ABR2U1Y3_9ROSI